MFRLGSKSEAAHFLLLICTSLILRSGVSCRDSFNGGRKTLELAPFGTFQNDVEQMLTLPSSVCRIVYQEGDLKYCFGTLVSSRWVLTTASCAPKVKDNSISHVRVVCGTPSSSSAFTDNEFNVVETKTLRNATAGERQAPGISLLKLSIDAPGPYVKFEERDGPDFYILEEKELMRHFFGNSDVNKEQAQAAWNTLDIDLIGLPLIANSSALNNDDTSENALLQITTCYLATACQFFKDGVNRCTFSRITPREHKFIYCTTGICNAVPSASSMTPSFHRSLSLYSNGNACPDSPRLFLNEERLLIPPFVPLICFNENLTELQSMSREQIMPKLKHLVNNDDATGVSKTLTCSNFSIRTPDNHHETLLHDAAWHNSSRSAKVLCESGINTEVKNKQGKTALLVAANRTSFKTLKVILNCSANMNATDNKGRTALHFAAIHNSNRIAKILCSGPIDLEARDDKNKTALIVAAMLGNLDALKVIVNSCKNVNVNATDNAHRTALFYAVLNNSSKMAKVLCNASIDTEIKNKGGRTALLAAAFQKRLEALKMIVNRCANVNVNAKGNEGKTALHYAAKNNSVKIAQVLCSANISANITDNENKTALVVAANNNNTEPLKVILNSCANVNVNATDKHHKTALHYATKKCNFEMAQLLVNHHANCSIVDKHGHLAKDLIPSSSKNCQESTIDRLRNLFPNESNQNVGQAT